MKKEPAHSNMVIKIVITIGLLITVTSLYLLLSIEVPPKPLTGEGDMHKNEVQIGGDFELIDQNGKVFNSDKLKGKFSLIYFGFTYCPDICPTSLQKIVEVYNTLQKYQINIQFAFITIDPKRDTPLVLKEYLSHFNPQFIGLTGSEQQIKAVADIFKVYYAKVGGEGEDYMLDHSSFLYLMNQEGKYLKHFYLNSTPQEIIEYVRLL
ncbi:SCO family protein [Candidatus Tisiphia endosymbiont of Beris chalybata]|uniref:SCO family protein n=1 Tax=Candidatus Tisiphia endosymbiont of Beris chalybata TaxID=3066262 RepID=UPI00312CA535